MTAEERRTRIIEKALDEIRALDLEKQAEKGGFDLRTLEGGACILSIPSFGGRAEIKMPHGDMAMPRLTDSLTMRVLTLRFVKLASGVPVSGEWIAYRDLPGGRFYAATLVPTVEQPLANLFGIRRGLLGEVSRSLGGTRAGYGDEAYVFPAFPRVLLLVVLHWGDDEFPPEGNILFDRSITNIFSAEDVAWLSGMVVYPLAGMARGK